ncbi:MAG: prepilin peptidase [Candidatus Caldatribacteriaceae bacterium]
MLLSLFFSGFLIFVALFDLWTFRVPDWSVGVLLVLGVLRLATTGGWVSHLLGALVLFTFFLLLHLLFPRGMGFGDVKLSLALGLFLGLKLGLLGTFLAFAGGGVMSAVLLLLRRKTLKDRLPFAPFLSFGAVCALFFGDRILSWYFTAFFPTP